MTSPAPDWVEQARRFLAGSGLADVLTAASAGLGGAGGGPPTAARPAGGSGAPADHSAECRWCPLCAGLAALRGRRPDLIEGLADVLDSAVAVLRVHAATVPESAAPTDHGADHGADPAPADPAPADPAPADPAPAGPAPAGPAPAEPPAGEHVGEPSPAPVQRIEVA
jgi:hypothetical protein